MIGRLLIAFLFTVVAGIVTGMITNAHAWTEGVLKVADPSSFAPNDLSLASFKLEGPIEWEWVDGSFEWVRLDKKFLIPRAKIKLGVSVTAKVIYQKQVFLPSADGKLEIPVVLTQEPGNEITLDDPVTHQHTQAKIVFTHGKIRKSLAFDSSCSPYGIQVSRAKLAHSWVYFVCRAIHPISTQGYGMKLDVDIFWEMEGAPARFQINQHAVDLDGGLTASIAVDSNLQSLHLQRGDGANQDEMDLKVSIPERFRPLGVSLGLGPYSHQNELRAFATVYMSYYFTETMKLAAFGAFPLRSKPEVDLGLYLIAEQVRAMDERMSVNLLLGAHALSYTAFGTGHFSFSAPQGVEIVFRDFLVRRRALMVGGFFYPSINGRSYMNTWIRYGGSTFVELNFINWQEPVGAETFEVKSFGLSVGFPLFRAF